LQPDYEKIAWYCNIWRNYNDIGDSWDSVKQIVGFYGDDSTSFSKVAAPGSFNDPDMVSCLYLQFVLQFIFLIHSPVQAFCEILIASTPCPEKTGTNNVLGITLTNTNVQL